MSELIVQCRCGAKFAAEPRLAGQKVACSYCGTPLVVPAPQRAAAPGSPTPVRPSPVPSVGGGPQPGLAPTGPGFAAASVPAGTRVLPNAAPARDARPPKQISWGLVVLSVFVGMGVALLAVGCGFVSVGRGSGIHALLWGILMAAMSILATGALLFGIIRRGNGWAALAGAECLVSLLIVAGLAVASIFQVAVSGPESPNTAGTGAGPGMGSSPQVADANSAGNVGANNPSTGGSPQPAAKPNGAPAAAPSSDSLTFPDKTGPVPVDPCRVQMPERFVLPPLSGRLVPAGGGSRLAVDMDSLNARPRIQIYDLFTDTIQSTTRIRPFAPKVVEEAASDSTKSGGASSAAADEVSSAAPKGPWAALGCSPAGQFAFVVREDDRQGEAEVWRLGDSPAVVARIPAAKQRRQERFVYFPDEQSVAVSADEKELQWWSLTTGELKRRGPNGLVVITPGGRYLAIAVEKRIGIFDAAQGGLVATVGVGQGRMQEVSSFGISSDGGRMLAFGNGNSGGEWAECWNLKTRSVPKMVLLPDVRHGRAAVHWFDDQFASIGPYLFDAERAQVVWKYEKEPWIIQHALGKSWMHVPKVTAPVFTVVSRVNDETRARMSEFAALSKQIFDLGQPVKAVVVFQQEPPSKGERDQIVQAFHKQLAAAGHPVRDDSPVVVTMTVTDTAKPGSIPFVPLRKERDIFGNRKGIHERTFEVPQRELRCEFAIQSGGASVAWSRFVKADVNDINELSNVKLLKDDVQEIHDARWPHLRSRLNTLQFPEALADYSQLPQATWVDATVTEDVQARIKQRELDYRKESVAASRQQVLMPLTPPARPWSVALEKYVPATKKVMLDAPLALPPGQVDGIRFSSFDAGQVVLSMKPLAKPSKSRGLAETRPRGRAPFNPAKMAADIEAQAAEATRDALKDAERIRKAALGAGKNKDEDEKGDGAAEEDEKEDAADAASKNDEYSGKRVLLRYELRGRKRLVQIPLANHSHLADMRPDGQVYVLGDVVKESLQVWRCADEGDALVAQLDKIPLNTNSRVYFVGRDLLLVVGSAEVWAYRLPAGTLAWRKKRPPGAIEFSANREVFVMWQNGALRVCRSADGEEIGQAAPLPLQEDFGQSQRLAWAAFNPVTLQVAAAVHGDRARHGHVGVWNLSDGSLAGSFSMLTIGEWAFWTGEKELLVDERLVDVELQTTVWKYPKFLSFSPDGRAWFTMFDRKNVEHLVALAAPSRDVRKAIDAAKKEVPGGLAGHTFGLELQVSDTLPLRDELQASIQEQLLTSLRDANLSLGPSPTRLLRFQVHDHLDPSAVYRFQIGDRERLADKRTLLVSWQIKDADPKGGFFLSGDFTVPLSAVDYRIDETTADANATLAVAMYAVLLRRLAERSPFMSYGPHSSGFGSSQVDPDGEKVTAFSIARPR